MTRLYLKFACENDSRILLKIFTQAAQEDWEKLYWAAVDKSIDSMNKLVQHVLKKHRVHT
jgi:hypothetical protein